ncbi:MAG: large repetitive protein, partial [Pseudomonadota bacterium]|nr:large repetitive protein [Pseudomonadota bacterium]
MKIRQYEDQAFWIGAVMLLWASLGGLFLPMVAQAQSLSPGSIDFGIVNVGATSSSQGIALQSGSDELTSMTVAASSGFSATSGCSSPLAAGTSCVIDVSFSPTTTGIQTGTLTVQVAWSCAPNICSEALTVSLSGTGYTQVLAVDDAATTTTGTPVTIPALANDQGDGLSISRVSSPSEGSATISGNSIVYTPAAGFAGTDSFTYTITDGVSVSSAVITVTVEPPLPPTAADDVASTDAGVPVGVNVLVNDRGTDIKLISVDQPAQGSATVSGDMVIYTPAADFSGTDAFSYTIADTFSRTSSAIVTVTVTSPELKAVDDAATTDAGQPVTINVLANDVGKDLVLTEVGTPVHGAVTISGEAVIYTSEVDFSGTDSFSYTIRDAFNRTVSATVTVTVNLPGLKAVDDAASTISGQVVAINVLANDTGRNIVFAEVGTPAHGAVVTNGGAILYRSVPDFVGTDSFSYTIRDALNRTANAVVTVTVTPPELNAANDTAATELNQPVTINVLANDTGIDLALTEVGVPTHGAATISGRTVTYTPEADFEGTDSFSYTIQDAFNKTASATVTVTVVPGVVQAVDDAATTLAGQVVTINVLANDTGRSLRLTSLGTPAHGSATVSGGTITYTPQTDFAGTDSFNYTITDAFSRSASAIVTVTVTPLELKVVNDAATTTAGQAVAINVLANDVGKDLILTTVGTPGHGTATASGGTVTYTSAADFAGTDSFSYTIKDAFNRTAAATVTVTVTSPVLKPVNDAAAVTTGQPVTINVLANDSGTDLTLTGVGTPSHGTASISGGTVIYTPEAGFAGIDSFGYTVKDAFDRTMSATVTVTVVSEPLSVADDTAATEAGQSVAINVLANDTGPDMVLTRVSTPAHGTASISGGTIIYTPASDFGGTDNFSYTIQDA